MQYYGTLSKTYRRATQEGEPQTRYHVLATYPQNLITPDAAPNKARLITPKMHLQDGDRLTVFHSIAAGNCIWKNELQFRGKDSMTGAAPQGIKTKQWKAIFDADLPAKLTIARTGEIIDGTLLNNIDRPGDGYVLCDFTKRARGSLHAFADGDTLEVYSTITDGDILWQGDVKIHESAVEIVKTLTATEMEILNQGGANITGRPPVVERIANPLITPSVEEAQEWLYAYPVLLERAGP
ncbi:MAG: hypothetical protein CMH27_06540 [Micavibrio sp.]|nr:hypothetical protein [Micavibrio sp.]|tara:strand:+ start:1435 stop:2151 length:717 start_codon:yes stop_codon:yes gene_type:complete